MTPSQLLELQEKFLGASSCCLIWLFLWMCSFLNGPQVWEELWQGFGSTKTPMKNGHMFDNHWTRDKTSFRNLVGARVYTVSTWYCRLNPLTQELLDNSPPAGFRISTTTGSLGLHISCTPIMTLKVQLAGHSYTSSMSKFK